MRIETIFSPFKNRLFAIGFGILVLICLGGAARAQFPAPYCGITFGSQVLPVTSVNFAGIVNTSPDTSTVSLEDFTTSSGNVLAGLSYPITLQGNADFWSVSFIVYIDWNQNNSFEDGGEKYTVGTASPATGTIAVPATALAGATRMRVIMTAFSLNSSCSPGFFGYGQAEDYTLNVTAATCTQPNATYSIVPDCTSDQYSIAVNITGLGSAASVDVKEGTTTFAAGLTAPGTVTAGPFNSGTSHTITVLHNTDNACNVVLPTQNFSCPPVNDECSGAAVLTQHATCVPLTGQSTAGATFSTQPAPGCFTQSTTAGDLWYSFVATSAGASIGLQDISLVNGGDVSYISVAAAVYSSCSGTEINCNTKNIFSFTTSLDPIILNDLTVGQTYYVRLLKQAYATDYTTPVASADFNYSICIKSVAPVPPNDLCSGAISLTDNVMITADNGGATDDEAYTAENCGWSSLDRKKGVWYKLTPVTSGTMTISTCGSSVSTYLRIYSGGSCDGFTTCVGNSSDNTTNNCGAQARMDISVTAGTTYYILVTGTDATDGTYHLMITGVALSVNFGKLTGHLDEKRIPQLSWSTYAEINSKGFAVERSEDGVYFRTTGFVASLAYNGNSNEKHDYNFVDADPVKETAYYRLLQMDIDGRSKYSNTVRLTTKADSQLKMIAWPNPVTDVLTFNLLGTIAGNACLTVTDLGGRTIRKMVVRDNHAQMDLSGLAKGLYIVKYSDALYNQVIKITKH